MKYIFTRFSSLIIILFIVAAVTGCAAPSRQTDNTINEMFNILKAQGKDLQRLESVTQKLEADSKATEDKLSALQGEIAFVRENPGKLADRPDFKTIYFPSGATEIQESQAPDLEKNLALLQRKQNLKISITGYADKDGTSEEGIKYALARAYGVAEWYVLKGIDRKRIVKIDGRRDMGEDKDKARRVETIEMLSAAKGR
ncbi:MAG: OmpA family protein [Deltaproteobacteria bacterium]|nr:OmpA family protein [Deltaproteobacteria bacterium]